MRSTTPRDRAAAVADPVRASGVPEAVADVIALRRDPLVAEVQRRLATECELPADARVVVAASGGGDSLALVLAAWALACRDGTTPPVLGHVHHHLRAEADEDLRHVEATCSALGLTLRVAHVAPGDDGGNVEDAARRQRYDALVTIARESDAVAVVTAHHAEDQLETMLMALARGAGPDGLAGMAWRRPLAEGVALVRPMLAARRADAQRLCRLAGFAWREDATNKDLSRARARVRHEVLPCLEALWPGAAVRSTAAADSVRAARDALACEVERAFGESTATRWQRATLAGMPASVLASGLRRAALAFGCPADALGQEHLLTAARAIRDGERRPRSLDWPGGIRVCVRANEVTIEPGEPNT